MKITPTYNRLDETRTYRRVVVFRDAEPILLERRYSHGGKQFLPERAVAKWDHGEAIMTIRLYGPVLKKDGTPGIPEAHLDFVTPASRTWDSKYGRNAPEWLLELFADSPATTPEGA